MKVLTLKQPLATLIAEGYKKYEFRTWKTKYRGDILIHAGVSIDKKNLEKFKYYNLDYPLGCIIARATITDCIKVDEEFRNRVLPKNPLVYKNLEKEREKPLYGFKLENVKKIEPIYLKGQLGLWNYDGK